MRQGNPRPAHRRRLFDVLLLLVSVAVSIGAGEAVCRIVLPPPGFQPLQPMEPPGVWSADSLRGYRYSSHFDTVIATPDYRIRFATDALGLRRDPDEARAARPLTILALGNSFTVGWRIEAADAWPEQLENRLDERVGSGSVEVINAGVSGYNMVQIRRTAEHLIPIVRPDLIVVGIYGAGFDRIANPYVLSGGSIFRESMADRVRPADGGFRYTTMHRGWMQELDFWLASHFVSGAYAMRVLYDGWVRLTSDDPPPAASAPPTPEQAPGIDALARELEAIDDFASRRGIPVAALLISEQTPDGSFREMDRLRNAGVVRAAELAGIPVYDALPRLESVAAGEPIMRFDGDAHWTAAAHAIAAQGVFDLLTSAFRFDAVAPRVEWIDGRMVSRHASLEQP